MRRRAEPADVLIEPSVGGLGILETKRAKEAIAASRAAALAARD